jgi:hypothetical protein
MPKGEKVLSPKQKDHTTTISKLQIKYERISIGIISLHIYFKTLLKAKGRISFRGSFYLVKGKAFETGGEISNLKNASCNLIPIPLTMCKSF